jgi:hypothetical protein
VEKFPWKFSKEQLVIWESALGRFSLKYTQEADEEMFVNKPKNK